MRKLNTLYNISEWLISFCLLISVLASCQGGGGSNDKLSYDESINDEQQIELLKSQARSFADSVKSAGYSVLGIFVNEERHSVFYAKTGLKTTDYDNRQTCLPPIKRKNVKTGNDQIIQIPNKIDGHPIQANLIVNSYASDDKILLLSTSRNTSQVDGYDDNFNKAPIDVFYLDVSDLSFHYLCGGCHWRLGQENHYGEQPIPFLACYDKNIKIPLSQIFDGSFRFDNMTFNENEVDNDVDYDEYEEIEDNGYTQPTSSPSKSVSTKSDPKPIKTEATTKPSDQVNTAPAAPVREEKQTAPQAEQKAKANAGPEFQGGNYALTSYIAQHIHYPPVAAEKKIQGKVIVKVTISATGQVSNAEIVQSVDPMLDAEALRLAKSLPRFTPAHRNGQPVQSTMTIPINFRL